MAISILTKNPDNLGSQGAFQGQVQLDASYPTGGYSLTPIMFGMSAINTFIVTTDDASLLFYNYGTQKLMAFTAAGGAGGNTGSTSGGTPAGTVTAPTLTMDPYTPAGTNGTSSVSAQTFTGGRSPLDLATPVFSGTGLTAAGQVITTTDNQTMGVNECAGMWLISATGSTAPNLIISNTAVAAAPAVFTVAGSANTDAGAYSVVTTVSAGSNSTSTANAQVFSGTPATLTGVNSVPVFAGALLATHLHTVAAGGGGLSEVSNGTNLSTIIGNYILIGE